MLTVIALSMVLAVGPDDDAAAALALAQAKQESPKPKMVEKTPYQRGRDRAVALELPLIVWIGTRQWHRELPGAVTVWVDKLDGFAADSIVVGFPEKKRSVTLSSAATDAEIARAVARLEGRAEAPPFDQPQRTADVSSLPPVRWPEHLKPIRDRMTKYVPAQSMQRVFNQGENFDVRSRLVLESKWHVPGHLDGIKGWRSILLCNIADDSVQWIGDTYVENSFKNMQRERSHQRAFANGTEFMDALFNDTGEMFEARHREKVNGKWESSVLYKNPDARPVGYVPIVRMSQCAECHDKAGTGTYSEGLIPGGDGVLSYPMKYEHYQRNVWFVY